MVGRAAELLPPALHLAGAALLAALSLPPLWRKLAARLPSRSTDSGEPADGSEETCGCSGST